MALLLVYSSSPTMKLATAQSTQESTIFFDDFESDQVGIFPDGWASYSSGTGYQALVTNLQAHSGTKSLLLAWGEAMKTFSTTAEKIGYEVAVNPGQVVGLRFVSSKEPFPEQHVWANVVFRGGKIFVENLANFSPVGGYQPNVWYIVKAILDRKANTFSVWINGELKFQDAKVQDPDAYMVDALEFGTRIDQTYFDDARVFEVTTVTSSTSTTAVANVIVPVSAFAVIASIGLIVSYVAYRTKQGRRKEYTLRTLSIFDPASGDSIQLSVHPQETAASLIERSRKQFNLPSDVEFTLVYAGRKLEPHMTLRELRLKDGATLDLRPKG